ncbi:glycosyltransferase [Rhizobium sp. TH2]|uniref:glycosyltransferase n=1 Tax=Rhizobium sp. TH2 TaxID=2775403 RepID=UPI0021573362|nr:glycosyltransferase [Rhizobium sp. TH2]UVC10929.1 glycosyltransferase [Rhizobium sp. TH2]
MIRRVALALPTISPLGGGVAEAARLHVKALSSAGFEQISVHTLDDRMDKVDPKQWEAARLYQHRFMGPISYSFAPAMVASLMQAKPDLVHVHGVWQFHVAAVHLWSMLSGKPYVVSPHGMLEPWIRARSSRLKGAVSSLYQNRFLKKAGGYHLLTEKESGDVAEFLTGQPARIIHNFAEPFSSDGAKPGWWKPEFDGRDIYLFLGRIHEKKGIMELMDAWARLSSENEQFRNGSALVFCGWNDGIEGFEAKVSALGQKFGNVLFAGPQYGPDKNRSMGTAKFFLLPSKSEGLPMAILEAWAAGKPAIMSPECNLDIGFERGAAFRTGYTADTIYPSLVAAHNLSGEDWARASENAKALVAAEFSEQSVRDGLLSLYNEAVEWKVRG